MKIIYEGQVLNALPIAGGIVFAYVAEKTEDDKTVVAYQHINFDTGKSATVTKTIFQVAKFGHAHQKIEEHAAHHLTTLSCSINDGKTFLVERDGSVKIIDCDGDIEFLSSFLYKKEAPSSIVYSDGAIWASFKKNNVIIKYDLELLREEMRIGGGSSENSFNAPSGLFIKDNMLYICNEGSQKIWALNINSYDIYEAHTFKEPVKNYMQTAGLELVVLESGLYLL